jgi:hypothetical protein
LERKLPRNSCSGPQRCGQAPDATRARPISRSVTAGGPPSWSACAVGRLRRTAIRTLSARDRGRAVVEVRDAEWRLGVLMEGSQGSPGKGRPLARPAVVQCRLRRAPPSLALFCLRRFGCCPVGLYVSPPARLAPPSSGPAVQEMSLRRSFVAVFLWNFPPLALRVDRPPSATAPQASPAAKTTVGNRS